MHRIARRALRPASVARGARSLQISALAHDDTPLPLEIAYVDDTGYSLRKSFDDLGVDLYIGVATKETLAVEKPGNGGMRLMPYDSPADAAKEALALAKGMEKKHSVFNTGFSGIKLVAHAKHGVGEVDKPKLIQATADLLNSLQGTVYTGCDLNTTPDDMDDLISLTPYVLAGIPNLQVNPNKATAMGVVGGIEGLLDCLDQPIEETVFFVHGAGSTGSVVASYLVGKGCKVYQADIDPSRVDPGAVDLSADLFAAGPRWAEAIPKDVTFLVPCSCSNLLNHESVVALPQLKFILGATNLPFADSKAQEAFQGIFVPEGITSAGAVIADSVEHANVDAFRAAQPDDVYNFTRNAVYQKVTEAVALADNAGMPTDDPGVMEDLSRMSSEGGIVAKTFKSFTQRHPNGVPFTPKPNQAPSAPTATQPPSLTQRAPAQALNSAQAMAFSTSSTHAAPRDVAIIGGGIMGLSISYQLKRRCPEMAVVVLEAAPGLGYGSSGYSTGFLRAFYSFDNTMRLALDGIDAYKNWGAYTGLGDKVEAYFTETHALWMLGKTAEEHETMKQRLAAFGVQSEVMDAGAIKARFPVMNTDPYPEFDENGDVVDKDYGPLSALFEVGCGHMDSSACLRDMLQACKSVGVDVRFKAKVADVKYSGDAISGLELADGSKVAAGHYINCAGPWFGKINDKIGVKTTTRMDPIRIQVAHKALPDDEAFLGLPFVADFHGPSGIYFIPRRSNRQLTFGSIAHRFESEVVDPDDYNTALDPDFKQDYLNCLFHRLPTLPTSGEISGFSAMYTVNDTDVHPVIGPTKEFSNLSLCNGFSGHGFKLAPAVGSLVAQQLTGSDRNTATFETTAPVDFLDPNREPLTLKVKTHFA